MQNISKTPLLYSFIDGNYQTKSLTTKNFIDIINPALSTTIYQAEVADNNMVSLAVNSALEGFHEWSNMAPVVRGRILLKAAELLRKYNDELAVLESKNTGKPIQESKVVDIHSGADCLEYFAGLADKIEGKTINNRTNFIYTLREPLGVCLGIGAWNYPLQIACWKAAPALAAGNAMIFKPSELTPATALKLAEIFIEAGVPKGVFNVVLGDSTTGELLTSNPTIAKVSVTGSVATGKKVMSAAASTLKSVTMELGGKSPLIILDDADIDEAVNAAMIANFYTQGEICSNGTRVFVQDKIHDIFVEKLVAKTKSLKIGDPLDINTQVGSLISEAQLDKVLTFIEIGKKEGAKLVYGGNRVEVDSCNTGYYVSPTIFTECKDNMQIVTEEIFGPVMSILKFSTVEEVISRANNTEFGLAAGLITQDLRKAHTIIPKLEAGTCWINNYNVTPIAMQFGGFKQSGIGFENGMDAINQYTKSKSIYLELDKIDSPY